MRETQRELKERELSNYSTHIRKFKNHGINLAKEVEKQKKLLKNKRTSYFLSHEVTIH